MQLFYLPELDPKVEEFDLSKEESRHAIKVLRKQTGDLLDTCDGRGLFARLDIEKKQRTRSYGLHLAIAPTKLNERFEWFLEKATEFGVDRITPLHCDRSERKVLKPERMNKILIAAMKQSLSNLKERSGSSSE